MKQYVMVNKLNPDQIDNYRQSHRTMHQGEWKEQLDVLRKAGCVDCKSYLYEDMQVLIYTCEDINESFKKLAQDPRRQAWEEFTQPMFANSPKFDGSVEVQGIEKVFDLNEQLDQGILTDK